MTRIVCRRNQESTSKDQSSSRTYRDQNSHVPLRCHSRLKGLRQWGTLASCNQDHGNQHHTDIQLPSNYPTAMSKCGRPCSPSGALASTHHGQGPVGAVVATGTADGGSRTSSMIGRVHGGVIGPTTSGSGSDTNVRVEGAVRGRQGHRRGSRAAAQSAGLW